MEFPMEDKLAAIDLLGDCIEVRPAAGGPAHTVEAVVERRQLEEDYQGGISFGIGIIIAVCKSAKLKDGDAVTLDGVSYRARKLPTDGSGYNEFFLEEGS